MPSLTWALTVAAARMPPFILAYTRSSYAIPCTRSRVSLIKGHFCDPLSIFYMEFLVNFDMVVFFCLGKYYVTGCPDFVLSKV